MESQKQNDAIPLPPSPTSLSGVDEDKTGATTSQRPGPARDLTYYIDEQMSIFLVDNCLFRVHRHFLRNESAVFDSMFDCPVPPHGEEGQSDEKPIVLPGVTRSEFVALMDYFYKGTFFKRQPGREPSLQDHINLLSIASRYECTGAHEKAISGIESHSIDPIQKIVLSDKYNVQRWLMPAYIELCKRDKPLHRDEACQIGFDKAMAIAEARENVRSCHESRMMIYNDGYDRLPSSILDNPRVEKFVNEALKAQGLSM